MRFGLFFTLQLPRPWHPDAERRLFDQALEQMELADELGFAAVWVAEQHFLEEYSHSSAPEVMLAAASQRTRRVRLGHGVALLPPAYNHPARVAERVATLDLISGGRVDLGVGDSKSRVELEGFEIDPTQRQAMTMEAVGQIADMLSQEPYAGHDGSWFTMPARNVVPKPSQRPHPPLWLACSDDATIHRAAQLGLGALAHGFFDRDEAARVVARYHQTFRDECIPVGHAPNPAVTTLLPFYCHADDRLATARGRAAHGFFTYAVRHYYSFGRHRPGRTNIAANARAATAALGHDVPIRGADAIGSPERITEVLRGMEDAGVDQVILGHQAGDLSHQEICAALRLFAEAVAPPFDDRERTTSGERAAALTAVRAAAMSRKAAGGPLDDGAIPVVDAYGRDLAPPATAGLAPVMRRSAEEMLELKRIALELDR